MNKFLTLVRRDMADNRGALIIAPIAIAAVILFISLIATFSGRAQFGFDPKDFKNDFNEEFSVKGDIDNQKVDVSRGPNGKIIIQTPEGKKTIDEAIGKRGKEVLSAVIPIGTGMAAALPLAVTSIIVLFLLAGALYDERKDRTILFWKSLPVSDLMNSAAKMVSIIVVGFAISMGVAMVLQLSTVGLALANAARFGVHGIDVLGILGNVAEIWLVTLVALIVYIGWALPVYAWFLLASAAAPKAPFVAAMVPLALAPAIAGVLNLPGDIRFWTEPLQRLVGRHAFSHVTGSELENLKEFTGLIPIGELIREISASVMDPGFIIGILIAAGFVYASSEVRRRRAL